MTKCSILKELPMLLLRVWKRNSNTFLMNSNWIASNTRLWKDDLSLTCKSTLLPVSTRLATIFIGESAPARILVFVWFCWNRINGQRGMVRRIAEWFNKLSSMDMFCYDSRVCTFVEWCSSEADYNICLYRIKSRYAFPPRVQLQVEAMVWRVCIKVSRM